MEEALNKLKEARKEVYGILELGLKSGLITQKERDIIYDREILVMTLEEVGRKFGVTRERIRQIEAKVQEKFRVAPIIKSNR